jgi:TonB family protein
VVVGYGGTNNNSQDYQPAQPRNGWASFDQYLKSNAVIKSGKSQVVKVAFTILRDGSITDIKIIKGVNDELNSRAIKLIEDGPEWTGATDGKPAKIRLRVKFHR